jgi:glucose/arabinose dehydrogenase
MNDFARRPALLLLAAVFLAQGPGLRAQDPKKDRPKDRPFGTDYGPFLACSAISKPDAKFDNSTGNFDGDVTPRGILVRLAEDWSAGVIFDADTMRLSAAWRGAPVRFRGVIFDGAHGPGPTLGNEPVFVAPNGPGWAKDGSFEDPRPDAVAPLPRCGPLPSDWAKYRGLYLNDGKVILSYSVGEARVLESIALEGEAFARSFHVVPAGKTLEVRLAVAGECRAAGVGLPEGAAVLEEGGSLRLRWTAPKGPASFKVLLGKGDLEAKGSPPPVDLSTLTRGGRARWTEEIVTAGVLSGGKDAYVVDRLTLPEPNPYTKWLRVGGFDFFSDMERAALCTWDGDVWVLSGVDAKLDRLVWKRFATGLHQPLGLRIVKDAVYVVGHDQITRLHDLNGDGEADFYENFHNEWDLTTAFHSFAFDLQTDPEGNFYFAFNAPVRSGGGGFHKITRHHGTILKVSPDGSRSGVFAAGFRANNGIGVGPRGEVTSGDNEGTWVPKCPLHWVKPGSFNGVVDTAQGPLPSGSAKPGPADQPKPICWMPKNVDNSGGGQVWVTSDRWGPFQGDLLHLSYGTSGLFKVMMEEVDGLRQGGVVRFPVKFTSSAMRARFNAKDGQLYVAGLRGWQSNAARDGGLDRVRYTGAETCLPRTLNATATGLKIGFTAPLDPEAAKDPENYAVEVWNYRWTQGYGSDHYSTGEADPKQGKGKQDRLAVKSVALGADGREVVLEVEGMKPVMQMRIQMRLRSASGVEVPREIYNTIHALGR